MRTFKSRLDDSTFDLNLAPMLDIIVCIIPMLLMSVAFIQVNMIETPIPQVVEQASAQKNETEQTTVRLKMIKGGLVYEVTHQGKKNNIQVNMPEGKFSEDTLHSESVKLKRIHPYLLKVDLVPSQEASFEEIVKVMDAIRKLKPNEDKFAFTDTKTGQAVTTDLLFPEVSFANVVEE
jgi:biopolymer transport protein ExbD